MADRINSSSSSRSGSFRSGVHSNISRSDRDAEDLDYFEVSDDIVIRPPSGTNHQVGTSLKVIYISISGRGEEREGEGRGGGREIAWQA